MGLRHSEKLAATGKPVARRIAGMVLLIIIVTLTIAVLVGERDQALPQYGGKVM